MGYCTELYIYMAFSRFPCCIYIFFYLNLEIIFFKDNLNVLLHPWSIILPVLPLQLLHLKFTHIFTPGICCDCGH